MKKLLPLLLLGVTAMFFSCESYDKNEGKANAPQASFLVAQQTLPFMGEITVKVVLDKPAEQDLTIPFTVVGSATENRHYEFIGLPTTPDGEETIHELTFLRGETETSFGLKHMMVNADPVLAQIALDRSEDGSYSLSDKKQILIRIDQRENVLVSFTQNEYLTREFSNITLNFTLTGEVTGTEYTAPNDLNVQMTVVPISTSIYQPQITNVPSNAYKWLDGSTATVELGENTDSLALGISYINQTSPNAPNDPDPIFTRGDDWPEGYHYRLGVTFTGLSNGLILGDIDTTYIYVKRLEDPIEEILMQHHWINPTWGLDLYEALPKKERLLKLLEKTGDNSWGNMPRNNYYEDEIWFEKVEGTGEIDPETGEIDHKYYIHIETVYPNDDINRRSDFVKFFKPGPIVNRDEQNRKYENLEQRHHPLGTAAYGLKMRVPANKKFCWEEANLVPPGLDTVNIYKEGVVPVDGSNVIIIPSSVMGDNEESWIDICILQGSWERNQYNFLYVFENWEDPDNPGNQPYLGTKNPREKDVWFRLYKKQ